MIHGNYYDKYRSKTPLTRLLTHGFLSAWSELAGQVARQERPDSILEIGCGDGYLLDYTRMKLNPSRLAAGLEPGILDLHSSSPLSGSFQPVAGSIYDLPFDDDAFDLVTVPEVFEHLSDPDKGLHEVVRVSRRFVLTSVPWEPVWRMANMARGKYWSDWGNTPDHVQHFSRKRFLNFLGSAINVTHVRSPFPWTMVLGEVRDL